MNTRMKMAAILAATAMLGGCATSPKSIDAAYVSPVKYQAYSCDDILVERVAVEQRAAALYKSLRKRATADKVKAGVGSVLFIPALFFLKGDGAKAAEYAEIKGSYKALAYVSGQKDCGLDFIDIDKKPSKWKPGLPKPTLAVQTD